MESVRVEEVREKEEQEAHAKFERIMFGAGLCAALIGFVLALVLG